MKIGEFAQLHNITQDTVRHYLDLGLLVTEKNGGQYDFSEVDSNDLIQIFELKKLNFSLSEVQKILTIQRISGSNTHTFRNLYINFLEEKKKDVESKLLEYNKINEMLKDKIDDIRSEEIKDIKKLGLPLSSLHILVCPKCHTSLQLYEGTIEENNVVDANIKCSCGYKAVIRNGIFINESSVKTKLLNGKKMPTKEEYLSCSSYEYNNFLYKGMSGIIEFINKYSHETQYILEMDHCVGFFLLQYIKYIKKESVCILIDYDIERISKLKLDLEMYYEHKNFIFLCCDYDNLPIKKESIDVLIDYNMSKQYGDSTGKLLYEKVVPLMKTNSILTGSCYFLGQDDKFENKYNKDNYIQIFNKYNLRLINSSDIGPAIGEGAFNSEFKGKNLYQLIYICKKTLG